MLSGSDSSLFFLFFSFFRIFCIPALFFFRTHGTADKDIVFPNLNVQSCLVFPKNRAYISSLQIREFLPPPWRKEVVPFYYLTRWTIIPSSRICGMNFSFSIISTRLASSSAIQGIGSESSVAGSEDFRIFINFR